MPKPLSITPSQSLSLPSQISCLPPYAEPPMSVEQIVALLLLGSHWVKPSPHSPRPLQAIPIKPQGFVPSRHLARKLIWMPESEPSSQVYSSSSFAVLQLLSTPSQTSGLLALAILLEQTTVSTLGELQT